MVPGDIVDHTGFTVLADPFDEVLEHPSARVYPVRFQFRHEVHPPKENVHGNFSREPDPYLLAITLVCFRHDDPAKLAPQIPA